MILKKDNFKFGLLLGFIAPILVFIIVYLLKFSYYPVGEFFTVFMQESRLITFFSVWCLLGNIGLFTLYINPGRYQSAKGIFVVTLFYGFLFLLLKLIS